MKSRQFSKTDSFLINTPVGPVPNSASDERLLDLLTAMHNAAPEDQAEHARTALDADPENIEARIVLAMNAATSHEAIMLLRDAVRIGDQLWAPVATGEVEALWWEHLPTQPYLCALHHLGVAFADTGLIEQARECFEDLLTMCPDDPLDAGKELDALSIYTPSNRR